MYNYFGTTSYIFPDCDFPGPSRRFYSKKYFFHKKYLEFFGFSFADELPELWRRVFEIVGALAVVVSK